MSDQFTRCNYLNLKLIMGILIIFENNNDIINKLYLYLFISV